MWLQDGNYFRPRDKGADRENLPPHVFTIHNSMMGCYLERQQEKFEFPYKLYGGSDFPKRVAHTYTHTTVNLGVLLNGIKGTGKTVEAEQICNLLKLPVMLVQSDLEGALVPFLNRIQDDIVVFIDEYEKIFEKSNQLLALMDGALRTKFRRVFILTTNDTFINDNMLNRPSRLLYVKQFGNLGEDMIMEILRDMIPDMAMHAPALTYLSQLEIITVDIVKAVCAEMLRFNELPDSFKHIMNIRERRALLYSVYRVLGGEAKDELVLGYGHVSPARPLTLKLLDPSHEAYDEYDYRFQVQEHGSGDWIPLGEISAIDPIRKTVTTDQGLFRISETKCHPSLVQTMFSVAY